MTTEPTFLAVRPDGTLTPVPASYEGIKAGVDGALVDFVFIDPRAGLYIGDESILNGEALNVPASMFCGRPLYGPVVLTAGEPDDAGDSMPADEGVVATMMLFARTWRQVVANAAVIGQDLTVRANADTLPPPTIIEMDDDQFATYLSTGVLPEGGEVR